MKTKSLLLTALLTAAGSSGLMAQVYSLNIVGYVNQVIPAGFSIIGCPLVNSPDNKLTTIFANAPENSVVYKWNNAQNRYYIDDVFLGSWEGDDLNMTLNPGEAIWFKSPSAFTNTLVGQVQLSSTNAVYHGFNIVSSVVPQGGTLDSLGYVGQEDDVVYQWNNAQGRYYINDVFLGSWEGDNGGAVPTVAVGEGFWVKNSGALHNCVRNFSVGP